MRIPGLRFREDMAGKQMLVLTALAGGAAEAQPLLTAAQWTAEYMSMRWGGSVVAANVNEAGEVLEHESVLLAAKNLLTAALAATL